MILIVWVKYLIDLYGILLVIYINIDINGLLYIILLFIIKNFNLIKKNNEILVIIFVCVCILGEGWEVNVLLLENVNFF